MTSELDLDLLEKVVYAATEAQIAVLYEGVEESENSL